MMGGIKLSSFHPGSEFQFLYTTSKGFGDMRNWLLPSMTAPSTCGELSAFLSMRPYT